MAHLIEPVTRQRDDQARLMNDSRKVSPLLG
ncbi:Trans-enoyl reductase ccsC, partial [Fusarium oxysporum f. sp. albedinis]